MILVNNTNKTFIHFNSSKRGEILGTRLYSLMALYFLFENNGDEVFFLASDWRFGREPWNLTQDFVFDEYKDVTEETLEEMKDDRLIAEVLLPEGDLLTNKWGVV